MDQHIGKIILKSHSLVKKKEEPEKRRQWLCWPQYCKQFNILNNLQLIILLDLLILLVLLEPNMSEARFKRCFTCRSRGALGDCRDPFTLNSTTFDGQANTKPSIEAVPCASGWCAKIIEDDYGDSIAATERSCMTRPPTDNEERCSETIFENHRDRKVFLCMCYGDLCNSATGLSNMLSSYKLIIFSTILSSLAVMLFAHVQIH